MYKRQLIGNLLFLPPEPFLSSATITSGVSLLTNGIGGMARIQIDLGSVGSKYDCLLGANLHPRVPSDRHVLIKRLRLWINADGFISPLDGHNLHSFTHNPTAQWIFVANAGDNRTVTVQLDMDMLDGLNTVVMRLSRPDKPTKSGRELPTVCDVRLIMRFDLEDRSFHSETIRNNGSDYHFNHHTTSLPDGIGFNFAPAADRGVRVYATSGIYHAQSEWSLGIPHPIEVDRGQSPTGDAWSPGWFDLPLTHGQVHTIVACADKENPTPTIITNFIAVSYTHLTLPTNREV